VQLNARKILIGLPIAGVFGAVLFPFAIYFIGLTVAPPPPLPARAPVPPMIAEAIWARADGGRATALTPITHVSMAQFAACVAIEDFWDTTPGDAQRVAACQRYMPAVQGVEYLSRVHMRGANLKSPFVEGLGRFSTTIWLTHSWTKAQLLSTIAERGEFGSGFRGAEAAARGYFGQAAVQLTLPQAAMIGAFVGARPVDPWCDPAAAAGMRRRVLERMRDNLAIDDAAFEAANVTELGLGPPPSDHKPCPD
jgi:hypothetical protein